MDRTLILVKPDAFARGLTGEIIARFERKGLRIVALQAHEVTEDLAKQHYAEHDGKPFFGELVEFITSGPLVAMVLEGHEAVTAARQVIGATNPLEATTGSIRGDFALEVGQNMVHGSDSAESAAREVGPLLPGALELRSPCHGEPLILGLGLAAAAGDPGPARRRVRGRARPTSRRWPPAPPLEVAPENAYRKAAAVAAGDPDRRVLGVDTARRARRRASTASRADEAHARATLETLGGRTHVVVSGALRDRPRRRAADRRSSRPR